jgi:hypothetical protein
MTGLRIIAPKPTTGDYTLARGTRVMVGNEELSVSSLDVHVEAGSLWRCTLETTAVTFGDETPARQVGPFSLQSLTWTPHEMARFQDAVRGVHRRFDNWRRRNPANARIAADYAERERFARYCITASGGPFVFRQGPTP